MVQRAADEIAVVHTPHGCYLPGGGIEPGEDVAQAVTREALEECGLLLEFQDVFAKATQIVYSRAENTCFEKPSTFVHAQLIRCGKPTQPGSELAWLSPADAIATLSPESHRWAVERLIQVRSNPRTASPA